MFYYSQSDFDVRFEWGLVGAKLLSSEVDVAIVVDVLSFSTCVEIGVSRGATIYPYLYKDSRALEYAKEKNAICLSPSTLKLLNRGDQLVLPSPNGSTISFSINCPVTLCGSLRNAAAIAEEVKKINGKILVIAAGEQWRQGALRPSIEDLIGAGAIISNFSGRISPVAQAAAQVFDHFQDDLISTLSECSSGKQLIELGFPEDIELAAELNENKTVPILKGRAYCQH